MVAQLVLYIVSATTEIVGIALVFDHVLRARRLLSDAGSYSLIDGGDAAGNSKSPQMGTSIEFLLKGAAKEWVAALLLVTGVLTGLMGNMLGLH